MAQPHQSIKMVSRRTGLSPHVIRIWEKRYSAVEPERTGTNRRLYSEDQIERLNLLRAATKAGHSIGNVARLATADLRKMLGLGVGEAGVISSEEGSIPKGPSVFVAEALQAVRNLDANELESVLNRAVVEVGQGGVLHSILAPLIEEIGDSWRNGRLKVAHEHIATAVIRTFLGSYTRGVGLPKTAPVLVSTTPPGQFHELGAVLISAAAVNQGWRVVYLGPCLPAEEIAGAAISSQARAVALSVVYPEDDSHLASELRRLRELLPAGVRILVGGRAAPAYADAIAQVGATLIQSLPEFISELDRLRKPLKALQL